jgi:hypothetical protein
VCVWHFSRIDWLGVTSDPHPRWWVELSQKCARIARLAEPDSLEPDLLGSCKRNKPAGLSSDSHFPDDGNQVKLRACA